MNNKYKVIKNEKINDNTKLFTLIDLNTNNDYSCIIEKEPNNKSRVLADDLANIYDVGEALFQYDLDLFPLLPNYMITPNMEKEFNNYYPGKGQSSFKNEKDFEESYLYEEQRIKTLRSLSEEEMVTPLHKKEKVLIK